MWILPLVGYLGVILGFSFLTLAIASGLYYLSELVEEHTVLAKKLLTRLIYAVMVIQALLALIDRFPVFLSFLSIGSHAVYMQNLRRFPVVKLTDPLFLVSCGLVLLNHYLWFSHFSHPSPSPSRRGSSSSPYGPDPSLPTFTEIASYFGLCVWLVPFALFVSLSAGENVLPSMGSEYATGEGSSFVAPGAEPSTGIGSGMGLGEGGLSGMTSRAAGSIGLDSMAGEGSSSMGGPGLPAPGRKRRGTNNAGMAKAVVNGVREWVGETGEVMGFWRGERTRPF